ncbi:DNA-binding protein [bacterium 1XD42-1]|nr:DNA-binding protein [bacterium 1XD42-1]
MISQSNLCEHYLRVGRCSTYKLLSKGKIRAFKIGNQYKIPKRAVLEYIQNEQQ